MKYLHVSFDLWMTLIRSNPEFKMRRVELIFEKYNTKASSKEEIGDVLRKVDVVCNKLNEVSGGQITSEQMYWMVLIELNPNIKSDDINMTSLQKDSEDLFFQYPPVLYDENIIEVLKYLKRKKISTNILSNTAFIKGKVLRKLLKILDIEQFFNFQIYSDEVNFSKPSSEIFEALLYNTSCIYINIPKNKILHVGDNPIADINGAKALGIDSLQINSNQNTITSLYNYL